MLPTKGFDGRPVAHLPGQHFQNLLLWRLRISLWSRVCPPCPESRYQYSGTDLDRPSISAAEVSASRLGGLGLAPNVPGFHRQLLTLEDAASWQVLHAFCTRAHHLFFQHTQICTPFVTLGAAANGATLATSALKSFALPRHRNVSLTHIVSFRHRFLARNPP